MQTVNRKRTSAMAMAALAGIAIAVFALDQWSKHQVIELLEPGQSTEIWGELLRFTLVFNPGAAFSLASGMTWLFTLVAGAVIVVIIVFARKLRSWPWVLLFGMLLGGVLGNLYDRIFREPGVFEGHVVDFIHFSFFPAIFNVADIFIVSSMGLFLLLTLLGFNLDGTRHSAASELAAAGDEAAGDAALEPSPVADPAGAHGTVAPDDGAEPETAR